MDFLDEDFFLEGGTARELYHEYAERMPIFDYHCHLSPKEIAEDLKYDNIAQVWLGGDHYKWRLMRANGIDEAYITGDADDREKFRKWAETMPRCIGNPMYVWSHLELRRYFGINELLSPETADRIWDACNEKLRGGLSARQLIRQSNVKALCTTDNPADSLTYHKAIAQDESFGVTVAPAFRPDPFLHPERPDFAQWIKKLSDASGRTVASFDDLKTALRERLDFFHRAGCRISDHGLDRPVYRSAEDAEAAGIFERAMNGKAPGLEEADKFLTNLLLFLGREYAARGWVHQYHLNAVRNNSSRMFASAGPDTGFDAAGDYPVAAALSGLLNALDRENALPKTILYSLNSGDYEALSTIGGCFNGEVPGKIQLGSAWWFNDHRDGILKQLRQLSNVGLLSRFVGMLTDSRSFLSYTRHEYFRRVLCSFLGGMAERGEIPADKALLGKMVQDICCNNAVNYFALPNT